jgi:hypothetical protein
MDRRHVAALVQGRAALPSMLKSLERHLAAHRAFNGVGGEQRAEGESRRRGRGQSMPGRGELA